MSLEARYRSAVNWYPREWRARHGEALVGTMLDQAEAESRSVPARGELRNLAFSAIRARFVQLSPSNTAPVRDRIALLAVLLGSSVALVLLITNEWAPLLPRETTYFDDGSFFVPNPAGGFGPFRSGTVVLYALWVLGFAATLVRQRVLASLLIGLTVPYAVLLHALRPQDWAFYQPQTVVLVVFAGLALLTLTGNARMPLPASRMLVGFVAAGSVGFLGLLNGGVFLSYGTVAGGLLLFDPRSLAVVLTALAAFAAYRRARAWTIALLVFALPWLLLVGVMATYGYLSVIIYLVVAAALLVAAIVLWRVTSGLSSRSS